MKMAKKNTKQVTQASWLSKSQSASFSFKANFKL